VLFPCCRWTQTCKTNPLCSLASFCWVRFFSTVVVCEYAMKRNWIKFLFTNDIKYPPFVYCFFFILFFYSTRGWRVAIFSWARNWPKLCVLYCASVCLNAGCRGCHIDICSDSRALKFYHFNSKLALECTTLLHKLCQHNAGCLTRFLTTTF
jgi:hypothetical protein